MGKEKKEKDCKVENKELRQHDEKVDPQVIFAADRAIAFKKEKKEKKEKKDKEEKKDKTTMEEKHKIYVDSVPHSSGSGVPETPKPCDDNLDSQATTAPDCTLGASMKEGRD